MLTGDLALSTQRGTKIQPKALDVNAAAMLQAATDLVRLVREHVQQTRGMLEAALDEYIGNGTDYKVLRGLMKLLLDRCEFASGSTLEPAALRHALFFQAATQHPIINDEARTAVLAQTATALGCAPADILHGLYADLPEQHVLTTFEEIEAVELLHRYNLAQAQALLYRCTELRIEISAAHDPEKTRQLFQAIKQFRLIHAIRGNARAGYEVRLSGPVSLFHRSQKYGIQMAVFLPALLLHSGWTLRAEIEAKRGKAFYEIDSAHTGLRSHYLLTAPNPLDGVLTKLLSSWKEPEWQIAANHSIVPAGDTALIPDATLRHLNGTVVQLELLGYWTPRFLQDRLLTLERNQVSNYLFVLFEDLRCSRDENATLPAHVVACKAALNQKEIARALQQFLPNAH